MVRNPRLKWKRNLAYDASTKKWHVRKMINGRVIQRAFHRKSSAVQFLNAIVDKAVAEAYGLDVEVPALTVEEAFEIYVENLAEAGRSPDTLDYYERKLKQLKPHLGGLRLDAITQEHVRAYVAARTATVSAETARKELKAVLAVSRELNTPPGWHLPKMSHRPKSKSVHQVDAIRALWPLLRLETKVAAGLCLLAGIRAAEAFRASSEWVHGDVLEVQIDKDGGKINKTFLVKTLRDILPTEGKLVQATEAAVRYDLEKNSKALKIDPPFRGPGLFRHHCATYITDLGIDRESRKLILGHGFGDVTDRYVHSQQLERKKSVLLALEAFVFPPPGAVKRASTKSPQRTRKTARKTPKSTKRKEG